MKSLRKLIANAMLSAGLTGLLGCFPQPQKAELEETPKPTYFASVPCSNITGTSMVSCDFNNDGYQDLILCIPEKFSKDMNVYYEARLYLFKNDGKGNFSQ